jgi:LysR family transcriptional regulator, glycine cleavage system transcriptional activator
MGLARVRIRRSIGEMDSPVPASFASLRAFREAARHGGFQAAARALSLTPSAVSHQIRTLEMTLGVQLFDRGTRSVRLTETGAKLFAEIDAGFTLIAAALDRARSQAPQKVKVSALASFTQHWLVPRLSRFEAKHPGIALQIESTNSLANFERDGVDVAIRNLTAPTPGLAARKLIDVEPVVVCAPGLGLKAPSDLARVTLIHISPRTEAWSRWLEAADLKGLKPRGNLIVDTIPAALEAAAVGQGAALAWAPLVWDAPAAYRLVAPFPSPPGLGAAYYVLCPRAARAHSATSAFIDWLVAEMTADRRRLARLNSQNRSGSAHL